MMQELVWDDKNDNVHCSHLNQSPTPSVPHQMSGDKLIMIEANVETTYGSENQGTHNIGHVPHIECNKFISNTLENRKPMYVIITNKIHNIAIKK